jgi:hypothetical protein
MSEFISTPSTQPVIPLPSHSGFGSLVVSMLASGTRVRGFKPGQSHQIFSDVNILSMPSRSCVADLRHVKEPLRLRESRIQSGILSAIFSPKLPSFANREAAHLSGSRLSRGLHARAAWAPLELTEGTKRSGAQRASAIQAYVLMGSSRSQYQSIYLSIYLLQSQYTWQTLQLSSSLFMT